MATDNLVSYQFTQSVVYTSYLQTKIAGLGLASTIDHIDSDGMTVTIWFQTALSAGDETTLDNFMASYTDPTVTQNALNSCISALNTDSNVILVARARIINVIPSLDVLDQLQLCTLLGVDPNS